MHVPTPATTICLPDAPGATAAPGAAADAVLARLPRRRARSRTRKAAVAAALAVSAVAAVTAVAGPADAITRAVPTASNPASVRLEFTRTSDGSFDGMCTGLVLSRHWVLTSAHCLKGRSVHTFHTTVARTNAAGTNDIVYPQGGASYYNHPDYDETFGTLDRGNDIGLVKLYGTGMSTFVAGRIYDGPGGQSWKGRQDRFTDHGYGRTDAGGSGECTEGTSGTKRMGWFDLTGATYDNGTLGLGDPLGVEAAEGSQKICSGDSGSPWSFDGPVGSLAFAIYSGPGARFHVGDQWATLIGPKLSWVETTTGQRGRPIDCTSTARYGIPFITCDDPTEPPHPSDTVVGSIDDAVLEHPETPDPTDVIAPTRVDELEAPRTPVKPTVPTPPRTGPGTKAPTKG